MIFLLFLFRFVFFAFSFRLFKFVFSIVFRVYLQARAFLSRLNILGFLIEICDSSHYSDYHNWKWVDLLKKVGKWRLKVHQYLLKILLQIEAWKKSFWNWTKMKNSNAREEWNPKRKIFCGFNPFFGPSTWSFVMPLRKISDFAQDKNHCLHTFQFSLILLCVITVIVNSSLVLKKIFCCPCPLPSCGVPRSCFCLSLNKS